MKIGLEATRANRDHKTGTEWYAWHLLQNFKKISTNHQFIIYYNEILAEPLDKGPANFKFRQLGWPFSKFWTHCRLSYELLVRPVDAFWASNAVPLFHRGRLIATIHDLGFYNNPELYHPLERLYQKISHWLAITKADKIIAISETTKKDIINFFPKSKNKIRVIYNGWDNYKFRPHTDVKKELIRAKYNLPTKFFLYIGRLETKKNIINLINGYNKTQKKWPLVLAGRPGNYGYDKIVELADKVDNIVFTGYLIQDDYEILLSAASAFVFPSKFEGFGIPILEAMGSGTAVVCSDIPVLKEIAANNVLYFDPDNIDDIAAKLDMISTNDVLRNEYKKLGLQRAKIFSWEKCAKETFNFLID